MHNTLGHFGADKSYSVLWESFYWPGMRKALEYLYIPSCEVCQWNKSLTKKPLGPLHPFPVPDAWGECVAINFVGPLPEDNGFN